MVEFTYANVKRRLVVESEIRSSISNGTSPGASKLIKARNRRFTMTKYKCGDRQILDSNERRLNIKLCLFSIGNMTSDLFVSVFK